MPHAVVTLRDPICACRHKLFSEEQKAMEECWVRECNKMSQSSELLAPRLFNKAVKNYVGLSLELRTTFSHDLYCSTMLF